MKKGFTLIELLAVIVILAIVAVITIPLINGIMSNAKKSAVKDSIYGIESAADIYYANNMEEGVLTESIIDLKGNTLSYKGKIDAGSLVFNDEGKTKIIVSDDKYCAYKDYEGDVQIGSVETGYCNINGTLINISTMDIGESELIIMVSSVNEIPSLAGIDNEVRILSTEEVISYVISNVEPSIKSNGTVWIKIDLSSTNYITMDNTYIPIGLVYQYDGSKWTSKDAYIYNETTWNKFSNETYKETLLNGTDPVLGNGLIPVTISSDGTVTYADIKNNWYSYEDKEWANAVILSSGTYTVGQVIPESAIQSYFVWIPRYKYKLWNTGTASKTKHSIEIVFENKTTAVSNGTNNGDWLTHPAFTSLNVNGIWVGKYETGYLGATSIATSQVSSADSTKIIVKPNSYSWRSNSVYNIFTSIYNYSRENDSHLIKNTEWGAVAYLSHSEYGINSEVNINNNSSYKTGYSALPSTSQQTYPGTYGDGATYNVAYNTDIGYLASTTGNISGIYDMSGCAYEYTAAYISGNLGSSGFTTTTIAGYDSKYFDVYPSNSTAYTTYNNRMLGDATGEIGPFLNYSDGDGTARYHNSWYASSSNFINSAGSWFVRGGSFSYGILGDQFNFHGYSGAAYLYYSSRLVLSIN